MGEKQGEKGGVSGERQRFLPNFCAIQMVFAVVITAELLAITLTLASVESLQRFADVLSLYSLLIQWIALAGSGLLCITRGWLNRFSNTVAGVGAWLLLQLVTLLASWMALQVLESGNGFEFILKNQGISAIVSALILRYLYIQYLWRQQVVAESQARFQALQSRIRPHFLFNSMNTIASLTRFNPELAEEVVYDFSDLFRASLSNAGRQSTLGDELELARGYLRIEKQRLDQRLRVEWDLEGLPEVAPLPALILQPLLENAVYHGIEPSAGSGVIHVNGRYRRKKVNLSIRNTLPPGLKASHRKGNRIALENIRQRLNGFFNNEASLIVAEVDGEYQVRVVFPYPWKAQ